MIRYIIICVTLDIFSYLINFTTITATTTEAIIVGMLIPLIKLFILLSYPIFEITRFIPAPNNTNNAILYPDWLEEAINDNT